eukprot:12713746-Alexandrium_andersonii.AAC.1
MLEEPKTRRRALQTALASTDRLEGQTAQVFRSHELLTEDLPRAALHQAVAHALAQHCPPAPTPAAEPTPPASPKPSPKQE